MKHFISLIMLLLLSGWASAGLLGTSVTGFIANSSFPNRNLFDSTYGIVPAGCQNSGAATATVTIVDPAPEFCIGETLNSTSYFKSTADFTDTTLTYSTTVSGIDVVGFFVEFTFEPGVVTSVSELSDTSGGTTYYFGNNILELFVPTTGEVFGNATFSTSFDLTGAAAPPTPAPSTIPEPSTVSLLAWSSCLGVVALRRRKSTPLL